ncbi:MAG: hypothetical protein ABI896_04600 [Actinomycetota bacterium]
MPLIDDWLPEYEVGERHDISLPVSPDLALELALAAPASPDRFVRSLYAVRGMRARDEPVERFFIAHRFVVLGRTPTEWVAGTVGVVWRPGGGLVAVSDAAAWRSSDLPGTIKAAIDFRAERIPGGSRLTTETRVKVADARARRAFRLYWLAVAPFSALIRRRWLRAVQSAAKQ